MSVVILSSERGTYRTVTLAWLCAVVFMAASVTAQVYAQDPSGHGAASDESLEKKKEYKKVIEWGLIAISCPKNIDNTMATSAQETATVNAENNAIVGSLKLSVVSIDHPLFDEIVGPEEKDNVPENKIKRQFEFRQKAQLSYEGGALQFMHPDDGFLPRKQNGVQEWSVTPKVSRELAYFTRTITWSEGQIPPTVPDPAPQDAPEQVNARNINPTATHMAIVGDWSNMGWVWIANLHRSINPLEIPDVELAGVGAIGRIQLWGPGNEEAKTNTIALVWRLQRVKKSIVYSRVNNGDWKVEEMSNWESISD